MRSIKQPRRRLAGKLTRVSGARAGQVSVSVWACVKCRLQYRAQPTQCKCGGIGFERFDSIGEGNRFAELLLIEQSGKITHLRRQVRFDLLAFNCKARQPAKVGQYVADFTYRRNGIDVIEDFKGAITDLSAWKLRHIAQQFPDHEIITTT